MLLDKTDTGIELTLGFPQPSRLISGKAGGGSSGDSSSKPFTFVTKTGKDIGEAYRKIQADLPRRITFGQLRNILISKEFAQNGIDSFVDFLARERTVHINANLFVTAGKAKKLIDIPVLFERLPSDILTNYTKEHLTLPVTAKDVLMSVYNGGDLILPILVFGNEGAESEKQGENWMGTNGAAIFKQGKMVSSLNTEEMNGALWILRQLANAEFNVSSPTDGKNVSVEIQNAKTNVVPQFDGDRIAFQILCKADANVIYSNSSIDFTDPSQLNSLEQRLDNELNDRIDLAISECKNAKSDAFQLGNYIKWRYPRRWEGIKTDWRQRFATSVRVEPQVHVSIKWFGAAQKPEWNRILSTKGAQK
jgi:spore germination protein KC